MFKPFAPWRLIRPFAVSAAMAKTLADVKVDAAYVSSHLRAQQTGRAKSRPAHPNGCCQTEAL